MKDKRIKTGIFLAVLSAALYAINVPFSKLLLDFVPPTMMAGLLYLGAGIGMGFIAFLRKTAKIDSAEEKFTKAELPYTFAMIVLDIAAPICLMTGLAMTTAANASLLNNFEYVATALIAFFFFREKISPRLWLGIILVVSACVLLSFEGASSMQFSVGSVFVLLSAVLWGIENNCTKVLSKKDPLVIVLLKGIFCGGTSFIISVVAGEKAENLWSVAAVLCVGLVAYGMSIFVYVYAQRILGAARTGVYSGLTPFLGTVLSLIIFREIPGKQYFAALLLMIFGAWLSSSDEPLFKKKNKTGT